MKKGAGDHDPDTQSSYLRDIRYFSVTVFMASLMSAAIINTQAGMNQIAELLAFFGLGYLMIGISAQLIRMRE